MRIWLLAGIFLGLLSVVACFGPRRVPDSLAGEPLEIIQILAKENQFLPPLLKTKVLRQVRLEITSLDADYDFQSQGLGVKLTRIPARQTVRVYFTPNTVGKYEFSSSTAPQMTGIIEVQFCPPQVFTSNPVPATAASVNKGKQVFAAQCAACHGVAGRGDGPASTGPGNKPIDLTMPYMNNITDGEMFAIISDGWYGMVPFKDKLSDEDRWNVINYIRTLSR